ncbi:hypothetical protein Mp_2g12560 [Marchantia polymorpha subsp. ruderalis]|uniref:Uncharacterized protein n=1 Tax=Marchantia polymorpha TaxID=3197 RepID=A0A2R6XAW2_MARPO|nr:hypothetical protein MARPO_0026s0115 [Marchantia polymorpha]BBN02078.1 hypothetical protein Mp_2g12560 [Marchantia polymorpha subsp. ruderalis]|eukprot:PTQ43243.1 hypothetical protein MARPO_0026s0115 [Marchantia polymorpha]
MITSRVTSGRDDYIREKLHIHIQCFFLFTPTCQYGKVKDPPVTKSRCSLTKVGPMIAT